MTERTLEPSLSEIADLIDLLTTEHKADQLIARYFEPESDFTGSTFNSLTPNHPKRIEPSDLLALHLLGIDVPARTVRWFIDHADSIEDMLSPIPKDAIWEVDPSVELGKESAAWKLWDYLDAAPGIGWVAASKIMARKRPALIPVIDSVVVGALAAPVNRYWDIFWHLCRMRLAARESRLSVPRKSRTVWFQPSGCWMP